MTSQRIWNDIQLGYFNDSSFDFKISDQNPPVLLGCRPVDKFDELTSRCVQDTVFGLECTEASDDGAHSAFVTFDVGSTGKKLVLWIWLRPDHSAAEIKTGIFSDEVFDQDLLQRLSKDEEYPENVGLKSELYWNFEHDGKSGELGIITDFERKDIESELSEYWSMSGPKAWIHIRDPVVYQENLRNAKSAPRGAEFYKIAAGWGQKIGNPVHENMTLAALIKAGCIPQGTTYDGVVGGWSPKIAQPDIFEFMRGVIWNDDPACYLFNDKEDNNGNFAIGADWGGDYLIKFKVLSDNIINRSHFGDLQFLHSMGTEKGQHAEKTKEMIMSWLQVMYKLAAGDGISEGDPIDKYLGHLFNGSTKPKGSDTLRRLIMADTPSYKNAIIAHRALGSCFHVIQDSYALGHCQRHLDNPWDQIDVKLSKSLTGKLKFWEKAKVIKGFPKGKPGRFSYIQNFHCYKGQDETHHGHYDDIPNGETLSPSDLRSFDCLVGGADAIDKCARLAEFWKNRTRWDDGVREFLETEVFVVRDAGDSDVNVDDHLKR